MTWLLTALLVASVLGNVALMITIWDMTSRHHAHALTLLDINDELSNVRSQLATSRGEIARLKAQGKIII